MAGDPCGAESVAQQETALINDISSMIQSLGPRAARLPLRFPFPSQLLLSCAPQLLAPVQELALAAQLSSLQAGLQTPK